MYDEAKEKQHFVLIHGMGHGAWCWFRLIPLLNNVPNTSAVALDLTSSGGNRDALADNVKSLQHYCRPLLEYLEALPEHSKVMLVGHSLGGGPLTYAMEMFPRKISKAIFICAFTPANGESFLSSSHPEASGEEYRSAEFHYESQMPSSVSFVFKNAKSYLYNECSQEDVDLAETLLTPTPYEVAEETLRLTEEKYGSLRRFYVMTMKDKLFFPEHQEYCIAKNPPEKVFKLQNSDHSPFLSVPEELCNLLAHIASL